VGTLNLLRAAQAAWNPDFKERVFYHISTDEVYGVAGPGEYFTEETHMDPRSPYSASKAGSDHFVSAFYHSFGLPTIISRCSNNYGPYHFPEKLIPLMINNILHKKPLPVYGKGENIRDWLYVEDHARAIDAIFHKGKPGEVYNIGGNNEWKNIDLVMLVCRIMDKKLGREDGDSERLITYVKDRPGHDLRYAIDASKLTSETGWRPETSFETGLEKTIDWYLTNQEWLKNVTSGEYLQYYTNMYQGR
jgi:dTDP-glucose 4,6-dehydratase